MAKKRPPRDIRFSIVDSEIKKAETLLAEGDIAEAASRMHAAAKLVLNLSDELRFDHGVKAGLARAKSRSRKK